MGFFGADVDELLRLSGTLRRASETMAEVRSALTQEFGALVPTHWSGEDADAFMAQWANDSEFLRLTADDLLQTSNSAHDQAEQQRDTSSSY